MNIKYVCTILIFLNITYDVIEWIIHVELRYDILKHVADRSPTSCSEVAERLRLVADRPPIGRRLVSMITWRRLYQNKSAIGRRLIENWLPTSPFEHAQKPSCDWFGRIEVPDYSPTSLQPHRNRLGTFLRPMRSVGIVSRGEVVKRLQRMCDRGLSSMI